MKIGNLWGASGVALAAACATGPADAQLLSLNINVGHTAQSVGSPRSVNSTGGTGGSAFPAGPGLLYSFNDFTPGNNFFPNNVNWILVPTNVTAAQIQSSFGPLRPLLASQTAYSAQDSETLPNIGGLISYIDRQRTAPTNDFDFDYQADCFEVSQEFAVRTGVPNSSVAHRCDALSAMIGMNGVDVQITAAEDSPNIRVQIPTIGVDYTSQRSRSNIAFAGFDSLYDRNDAFSQFNDFLQSSGKDKELAAKLLGVTTAPVKGTLPTNGDLFFADFTYSRGGSKLFDKRVGVNSFGELIAYLYINQDATNAQLGLPTGTNSYRANCFRLTPTAPITGACDAATLNFGLLGVRATLTSAENSPNVTLTSSDLRLNFTTTNALDRDDALSQLEDYVGDNVDEDELITAFQEAQIRGRSDNPVAGNPQSLQGNFTAALLPMEQPSFSLGEVTVDESSSSSSSSGSGQRAPSDTQWMIGGRIGQFEIQTSEATFVDVVLERGWRIGEGGRQRLKLSVPFSFAHYDDNDQSTASVTLAYEIPLLEGKWVVEPQIGAGYAFDSSKYAGGTLFSAGISSKFKIAPVGKGHIVIGNAVGYSNTIDIDTAGGGRMPLPEIENVSFRNGIAYQVPIGQRIFGRLGTLRASYAYTNYVDEDEKLFVDDYHEVAFSYGVAAREGTVRQFAETLRIGAGFAWAPGYESYAVNLGFRF